MIIKVIKATLSSYWYANSIGKEFEVYEKLVKGDYLLKEKVKAHEGLYFAPDDVEIIKKEENT